jgi:hypothetical protein
MEYEKRLIPILREGIHLVKMFIYKELRQGLSERYADRERVFVGRLTGAIINELFGTPNCEEPFLTFNRENEATIKKELKTLAADFPELKIPITDALRVQFICDSQEGVENAAILNQAHDLEMLMVAREFPLPDQFMNLARSLGEISDITRQVPLGSA